MIPPSASFLLLKVGAARCCCRGSASSLPPLPCFAPPVGAALLCFAPQIEGARLHLRRPRSRPSASSPSPAHPRLRCRGSIGARRPILLSARRGGRPAPPSTSRPRVRPPSAPRRPCSSPLLCSKALGGGAPLLRTAAWGGVRLLQVPFFFSAAVCPSAPGRRVHSPSSVLLPWGPLRLLLLSAAFRLGLPVWM